MHWQLGIESLFTWAQEQGIADAPHVIQPEDLGMRITYLATGPASPPDCDLAVPFLLVP